MSGSAHGHTPAAWAGVIIAFIGFCVGGVFMVGANVVGFWVGIGLMLLGAIVGGVLKMVGMGTPKPTAAVQAARDTATASIRARA
ncbi:HGxxPAAW family protein [Streptomyces sp. NPDC046203]|uniref:HGxxPAAW family protein n=1 Tax=Streptomyces sp. NPDC046203 TaxID=3154602 RepID=UPI0033FBEC80